MLIGGGGTDVIDGGPGDNIVIQSLIAEQQAAQLVYSLAARIPFRAASIAGGGVPCIAREPVPSAREAGCT